MSRILNHPYQKIKNPFSFKAKLFRRWPKKVCPRSRPDQGLEKPSLLLQLNFFGGEIVGSVTAPSFNCLFWRRRRPQFLLRFYSALNCGKTSFMVFVSRPVYNHSKPWAEVISLFMAGEGALTFG